MQKLGAFSKRYYRYTYGISRSTNAKPCRCLLSKHLNNIHPRSLAIVYCHMAVCSNVAPWRYNRINLTSKFFVKTSAFRLYRHGGKCESIRYIGETSRPLKKRKQEHQKN